MYNDKISVILTCYNHSKYIGEAINSIIKQTYDNRELLIGDDSPNNETWEVIKKYTEYYPWKIRAWHHEENKWIVRNMNFLFQKVDKDTNYIVTLEWDDYITTDYFIKKLEIFHKYDADLVYNDLNIIDSNWKVLVKNFLAKKWLKIIKNDSPNINEIIKGDSPYHSRSTLMFKRTLLWDYTLTIPSLRMDNLISDCNFFMQTIIHKKKIVWTNQVLTFYRSHGTNTWKIYDILLPLDFAQLIDTYYNQKIVTEHTKKIVLTRQYTSCALWLLRKSFSESFYYSIKYIVIITIDKILSYWK